jgi:hypothetical protein
MFACVSLQQKCMSMPAVKTGEKGVCGVIHNSSDDHYPLCKEDMIQPLLLAPNNKICHFEKGHKGRKKLQLSVSL